MITHSHVYRVLPPTKKSNTVLQLSPAQQLWIGEDLLQSAVVGDAKGEDGLSRVAGKMPGYARREGQHHLP